MRNTFVLSLKVLKKAAYYIALTGTFVFGIATFLSFSALFDFDKKKGEHLGLSLEPFYQQLKTITAQLIGFTPKSFLDFTGNTQVIDAFLHSYKILGISLGTIIVLGSLTAFLTILSPVKLRIILHKFLDYFEGLPDRMFMI